MCQPWWRVVVGSWAFWKVICIVNYWLINSHSNVCLFSVSMNFHNTQVLVWRKPLTPVWWLRIELNIDRFCIFHSTVMMDETFLRDSVCYPVIDILNSALIFQQVSLSAKWVKHCGTFLINYLRLPCVLFCTLLLSTWMMYSILRK